MIERQGLAHACLRQEPFDTAFSFVYGEGATGGDDRAREADVPIAAIRREQCQRRL